MGSCPQHPPGGPQDFSGRQAVVPALSKVWVIMSLGAFLCFQDPPQAGLRLSWLLPTLGGPCVWPLTPQTKGTVEGKLSNVCGWPARRVDTALLPSARSLPQPGLDPPASGEACRGCWVTPSGCCGGWLGSGGGRPPRHCPGHSPAAGAASWDQLPACGLGPPAPEGGVGPIGSRTRRRGLSGPETSI